MARFIAFLFIRAEALVSGTLGIFIGIGVAYWLKAIGQPEAYSVFGAFIGSAFAVGGAASLWKFQERNAQRLSGEAVAIICKPWFTLVAEGALHERGFDQCAQACYETLTEVGETLKRFDSRWQSLSSVQLIEFLRVEDHIRSLCSLCKDVAGFGTASMLYEMGLEVIEHTNESLRDALIRIAR